MFLRQQMMKIVLNLDSYLLHEQSSNGIFINGMLQEPYRMVQLHQDDIIGIGCADIEPDDTTLFAYKIYITRV